MGDASLSIKTPMGKFLPLSILFHLLFRLFLIKLLFSIFSFSRGEAGVAIILKSLDKAIQDQDHIYATVSH